MSSELSQLPKVGATLTVLSESEGGRSSPIFDQSLYRPHIVIGDPHQRAAIVGPDGNCTEDYLGIIFFGDGRPLVSGRVHEVQFALMYYPRVDYSAVVMGATFTVREGGRVVAFGEITSDVQYGSS